MIKLRDYQEIPVRKAIDFFRQDDPVPSLMVLPTGAGKSILAAEVAAACPDPILVVQPTKELLEQNLEKYRLLCGDLAPAGIYSASFGKKQIDHVTFATIGSIKNVGEKFKLHGFKKMLIDEAHLYPRKEQSMLGQFLKDSGIRQVLGITATPLKLEQFSEKHGEKFDKWSELLMLTSLSPSGTFFKEIIHVLQVRDIADKYWSKLVYEQCPFDKSMLTLNTTGSEFSEESEVSAYVANGVRQNIFNALDWHRERKHCIVFVPSVEEAAAIAQSYPSSAYVCGTTPKKERTETIKAFKEGRIRVLVNVGVLLTGFNCPEADMIILAFCTASVSKYYQAVGRGCRPAPGKDDCVITDLCGNVQRFGKAEDAYYKLGQDGVWRLYGTGGIVLTGFPIQVLGTIDRQDVIRTKSLPDLSWETLSFGKHKGKSVSEIPMSYRIWLLEHMRDELPASVADTIIRSMEEYIRDTTMDPPTATLPDGKHAGELIANIPTGYLRWYYNSKEWNETNDSLKRALEERLKIKD